MDLFEDENFDLDQMERLDQLENEIRAELNMEIELDVVQFADRFVMDGMNVDRRPVENLIDPQAEVNQQEDQAIPPEQPAEERPNLLLGNPEDAQVLQAVDEPVAQGAQNPVNVNVADPQRKVEESENSNQNKDEDDPILTQKGTEMKGFSCMICYDSFNTGKRIPKVFPCGHTFCLSCVQGLMKNRTFLSSSTVICPTCRQNTRYSMNLGAERVPTNFCLLAMLEQRKEEKTLREDGEMLECKECQAVTSGTDITICIESSCQKNIDKELLKDCDSIKRSKCLLICRTCIQTNHSRHNYISFEKVVAQYEVNQRVSSAEKILEKGMKAADDVLLSLKLTETEVLGHSKRMRNALENIRAEADHPQIYEYLNRYTETVGASESLFKNLIGDLNVFDFKSKARYYRSFGVDMLRPISIIQKSTKNIVLKQEPRDEVPNPVPRARAHGLNRPHRVARFNVIGPFAARNPLGNNAGDANQAGQLPPLPDIGNMMNRLLQQLDVAPGLPPLFAPLPPVPPLPQMPVVGGAFEDPLGAADPAAPRDNRINPGDRLNIWGLPRRFRRNDANIRGIRQNLIAAQAANPVLAGIPAIQQAIDGLRDNRDVLDEAIVGRQPLPADPLGLGQGIARAEQDLNRLRERLNRLEAVNANQRERQEEILQNIERNLVLPPRWVDQIINEPLPPLPPIVGVEQEVVQRAEIAELVTRVMNMVRNEAYAEAVANRQPLPDHVEMPPMLNPDAIPGVPDYNNLLPVQVAPFLVELRALELEWIQRGRDRRARVAPVVGPIAEPNQQPEPAEHNENLQQNPAPIEENVEINRDLPRPNTPVPDEPAAKRSRQ